MHKCEKKCVYYLQHRFHFFTPRQTSPFCQVHLKSLNSFHLVPTLTFLCTKSWIPSGYSRLKRQIWYGGAALIWRGSRRKYEQEERRKKKMENLRQRKKRRYIVTRNRILLRCKRFRINPAFCSGVIIMPQSFFHIIRRRVPFSFI